MKDEKLVPPYTDIGVLPEACERKPKLLWRAFGHRGLAFEWCGDPAHSVRVFVGPGPATAYFRLNADSYRRINMDAALVFFAADCQTWLREQIDAGHEPGERR